MTEHDAAPSQGEAPAPAPAPAEPPPPPDCPGGQIVEVRPGDTLDGIARSAGVALDALVAANPQLTSPHRIVPGEVVCIPPASGEGA